MLSNLIKQNDNIKLYDLITNLIQKINILEQKIKYLENIIDDYNNNIIVSPLTTPKNTINDFNKLMRENAESFDNLE